jgi:hypothetical protein
MAESPSSALPGGVEWLPARGGDRLLRAHVGSGEPAALILRTTDGSEHHIQARPGTRFSPYTEFLVPAGLSWATAWLQWPDGSRATIPTPSSSRAEIIELRPHLTSVLAVGEAGATRAEPEASDDVPAASGGGAAPSGAASRAASGDGAERAAPGDDVRRAASGDGAERAAPGDDVRRAASGDGAERAAPRDDVRRAASGDDSPAGGPPAPDHPGAPDSPPARGDALSWTALPVGAPDSGAEAEAEWHTRRTALDRELSSAAAAIARAREGERAARDSVLAALAGARADLRAARAAREAEASTLTTLAGELDAERTAHAVTRGSVGSLADALAAARAELAAERAAAELERTTGADARAHLASARRDAAIARAELVSLRADLALERSARQRAETALRETHDGSELLQRVADLDRHAAGLRDQVELERRAREHAEAAAAAIRRPAEQTGRMVADLDAAAALLRAAVPPPEGAAALPRAAARHEGAGAPRPADAPPEGAAASPSADAPPEGAAASPSADAPPEGAAASPSGTGVALVAPGSTARLRRALVALARVDPVAAGQLLAGLLPAQGAALADPLSYDLTVRGVGTYAVSVADGVAKVQRLSRRRPRGEAAFHLDGDPLVLAELLAGEERRVGRFARGARLKGRRKRVKPLAALPATDLSLADAVRAGARLEPSLVYRALPFAVEPEWTRGHAFTVAQEIVELAPRAWYVTARDGEQLEVVEHLSPMPADATVTMTRAAFERFLTGEPASIGERPVVRGDRAAVAALKRWTDLARGA